jgi:hypothetical protein
VQNVNGGSVEQVAVVITAVSNVGAQSERVRIQYTDEKGLAQAVNLPPGDYKVFAIEDNDDDTTIAQSPEFLAEVGNKVAAVTIRPYSAAPVDLKILTADEGPSNQKQTAMTSCPVCWRFFLFAQQPPIGTAPEAANGTVRGKSSMRSTENRFVKPG